MSGESEFGIWPGKEIYTHVMGVEVPLIRGLVNEGDIVCVQAEEGVGKSVLGQNLMFDLTESRAFVNTFDIPKKNNVLWNMGESKKNKFVRRLNDMKKIITIDDNYWTFHNCCDYSLELDEDFERFARAIESTGEKFDVMFFDSLYGFFDNNENDNKPVKKFCKNMRKLAGLHDCTMVFFNHVNKDTFVKGQKVVRSNRVAGSKAWGAFFTTVFLLEKRTTGLHYLENTKDRDGDAVFSIPFYMETPQREGRLRFTMDTRELNGRKNSGKHKVLDLLRDSEPKRANELYNSKNDRDENKVSHATFYRVIKELVQSGTVRSETRDGVEYYSMKQLRKRRTTKRKKT